MSSWAEKNYSYIINSPDFDLADKNRARKLDAIDDKKKEALNQIKDDKDKIYKLALEYQNNGGRDGRVINKINEAKTPVEALSILASSGFGSKPEELSSLRERELALSQERERRLTQAGEISGELPRKYSDEEFRIAVRDKVSQGLNKEEVLREIETDPLILNKDRARLIAGEIVPKEEEQNDISNNFFSRLFGR